jgi:hypothetical protein
MNIVDAKRYKREFKESNRRRTAGPYLVEDHKIFGVDDGR